METLRGKCQQSVDLTHQLRLQFLDFSVCQLGGPLSAYIGVLLVRDCVGCAINLVYAGIKC